MKEQPLPNLNRIILIGKVKNSPEARYTVDGMPMTKFQIEVSRFTAKGQPQAMDIIDIVTWRKLAEISGQFLKKGQLVLVEGRIQIRTYQADSGVKKWATEVVARNIQFLSKEASPAANKNEAPVLAVDNSEDQIELESDDLPF
jgi:single-strand DNA-binding protein